ncbi:Uncharacterised protein [Escherichia coli]|uniref:Uncharacterized protein n=1 Tax=Escherichia coli TaxID=562 RepID=A0A376YMM1_ECOLX|nr:Uncharacterised protein [Escherichia coli]
MVRYTQPGILLPVPEEVDDQDYEFESYDLGS